jgi:catechol 2,3-dioxygenase-like lactoylglutathione lyase family enzyme
VERVDFVSVPTRDVPRAARFYGEVLGLTPSASTPGNILILHRRYAPSSPSSTQR